MHLLLLDKCVEQAFLFQCRRLLSLSPARCFSREVQLSAKGFCLSLRLEQARRNVIRTSSFFLFFFLRLSARAPLGQIFGGNVQHFPAHVFVLFSLPLLGFNYRTTEHQIRQTIDNILLSRVPLSLSFSFFSSISSSSPPFLQGALVQVVLEPEGDGDEDEVEDEHGEPHALGHLPVEDEDGEEDEEEHAEEDGDRADHPGGRHLFCDAFKMS